MKAYRLRSRCWFSKGSSQTPAIVFKISSEEISCSCIIHRHNVHHIPKVLYPQFAAQCPSLSLDLCRDRDSNRPRFVLCKYFLLLSIEYIKNSLVCHFNLLAGTRQRKPTVLSPHVGRVEPKSCAWRHCTDYRRRQMDMCVLRIRERN